MEQHGFHHMVGIVIALLVLGRQIHWESDRFGGFNIVLGRVGGIVFSLIRKGESTTCETCRLPIV